MIGQFRGFSILALLLALVLPMLQACEGSEASYPTPSRKRGESEPRYGYGETRIGRPTVFSEGGIFGRSTSRGEQDCVWMLRLLHGKS